uniref:Uncharacterized protein n=1 Tax=Romanomermis culicivorax TaxID=13658 RepID=A0A915HZA9_ROMCU
MLSVLFLNLAAVNQLTAYSAAKHAAVGFHRSLSMELDDMGVDNVKLTLVCPYYIRSEKTEGLKT